MTIMARTKKQTLENASERKRQIQEEILRESLAAKQKDSNPNSKGNKPPLVASNADHLPHSGVAASGTSEKVEGAGVCRGKSNTSKDSTKTDPTKSTMNESHSATPRSPRATPAADQGNLPQAVICIPDICRNSVKHGEDDIVHSSSEPRPKGLNPLFKACSEAEKVHRSHSEPDICTLRNKKHSKSHEGKSKNNSQSDVSTSLESFKAASEKVRDRKSKQQCQPLPSSSSHKKKLPVNPKVGAGRRSPRQHSPISPSDKQHCQNGLKKHQKSLSTSGEEKPKVNIFTDNMGVDLGKRIRSPRRLSEDMIALPIFSARRWSNLPREGSVGLAMARPTEEGSLSCEIDSPSLHANSSSEVFKSPTVSPISSRKSHTSGSPQKTPSSAGSKSSSHSESQTTPPSTCAKNSDGSNTSRKHRSNRSVETSPNTEMSSSKTDQAGQEHSCTEIESKAYPLRKSKSVVSRELQYGEEAKQQKKSNRKIAHSVEKDEGEDKSTRLRNQVTVEEKQKSPVHDADVDLNREKITQTKIGDDVEELMSSVCREFMIDGVIAKSSDTDKLVETVKTNDIAESKTNVQQGCEKPEEKIDTSGVQAGKENENKNITGMKNNPPENGRVKRSDTRSATKESAEINSSEENVNSLSNSTSLTPPENKRQSSLLCAMLVGGTEVANTYSQERERCKPAKAVAKTLTTSSSGSTILPSPYIQSSSTSTCDTLDLHKQGDTARRNRKKENQLIDTQDVDKEDIEQECPSAAQSTVQQNTCSNELNKECEAMEVDKIEIKKEIEESPVKSEDDLCDSRKRLKIDISSKLKKLNENVLKLLEIDVEEEFLKDVALCNDTVEAPNYKTEGETEAGLYGLISSLGDRLKDIHKSDGLEGSHTPVDTESVEKLIDSCSHHPPSIIPKLDLEGRMQQIQKRLKEEELKEIEKAKKRQKLADKSQNSSFIEEDEIASNNLHSDPVTTEIAETGGCESFKETIYKGGKAKVDELNCSFGSEGSFTPSLVDFPAPMMSSPSSLNDSLCDLDLDAITSAATNAVNIGKVKQEADPVKHCTNTASPAVGKHSFQKSRTCDDFSESNISAPSTRTHMLRRVNSSPQINTKPLPSSPSLASSVLTAKHETHVKSKLGSKIPVPGTSYTSRTTRKTWRTPRIIMDPKPLSVLSELEEISSQSKNIFTCPNLQKYLNIPSNRIIVPPEKKKEIEELDAKAKEEELKRATESKFQAEKETKKEEDKDKKTDEEISVEYAKYEPDFDEVDGMLFMSFSNEVELAAHIRVEKALEWDKDDTMLRISRAKAFEEAKAHNEDMGDYKFKHLRGQHMRWKKYRRLYSSEVKTLIEARENGIPLETLASPKKTSDITKIKGWKKKQSVSQDSVADVKENIELPLGTQNVYNVDYKEDFLNYNSIDDDIQFLSETVADQFNEENEKLELSPRSKRRQGFSHQKAHKQLFRELRMDWEDRMIHRKLGGWSLKGNRPKAFSQAAIKRQEKECKGFEDSLKLDIRDTGLDSNMQVLQDMESELLPETKERSDVPKKKKSLKLIYPILTEKMARNALRTLETGAISRSSKRKKKRHRQDSGNIPALTPIALPVTPLLGASVSPSVTPVISSQSFSTPSSHKQHYPQSVSSSASAATTPLELDLRDEPVMEGVDTAVESISSPSLVETSSSRSCGKPGCRYGCICHLCSVNEASAPPRSPVAKPVTPACDKEYCRLGCICDSIDPDKQLPNPTHCGKASCMLHCVCNDQGGQDGNDDIPFLPSMKRRPKPGDRFSNLPQRERTHRSAKNLDAITRKALMLYETSEIYCEKIERVRKKPDATNSPSSTPIVSPSLSSAPSPSLNIHIPSTSQPATDIDIVTELDDGNTQADILFNAVNLETSEATTIAASHLPDANSSHIQCPLSSHPRLRYGAKAVMPTFIIDDVRQTLPIVEPSAHKRKRKSHPLSNEIFTSSTCARTQAIREHYLLREKIYSVEETYQTPTSTSSSQIGQSSHKPPAARSAGSLDKDNQLTQNSEPDLLLPKITSVQTLAPDDTNKGSDMPHWEDMRSGVSEDKPHKEGTHPRGQLGMSSSGRDQSSSVSKTNTTSKRRAMSGGNTGGPSRTNHGWHTSMVCLKARAPRSSHPTGEEDIQEEDEVKLLEFAANCNWEGAKKEILGKVAQCLSMGQYPQPRTMNVCEFVVEILPKAHQPSLIPPELRAKLPGQMYSIRVRITRRETTRAAKNDLEPQVIDLSEPSPAKENDGNNTRESIPASVVKSLGESFASSEQKTPEVPATTMSTDSQCLTRSSSFGISGLRRLNISNSSQTGKHSHYKLNDNNEVVSSMSVKSSSAPNSRRTSCESNINDRPDGKETSNDSGNKVSGSSFMRIESGKCLTTTSNSALNGGKIHIITAASSTGPVTTSSVKSRNRRSTAAKKENPKSSPATSLNSNKTIPPGVSPVIGPFNSKDFKILKIPGHEGMMKILEMGGSSDKKKLIAVPVNFPQQSGNQKGKQTSVPVVALPVNATGQNKMFPILTSPTMSTHLKPNSVTNLTPQQFVLKLPPGAQTGLVQPTSSGGGKSLVVQTVRGSIKGQPPKIHILPLSVDKNATVAQTKVTASEAVVTTASSSNVEVSKSKALNSNDEMIMVFDAAHIKASRLSKTSIPSSEVSSDGKDSLENSQGSVPSNVTHQTSSTLVTLSRDRPIMSPEISLPKHLAQLDGSAEVTEDKVMKAPRSESEMKNSKGISTEALDECDGTQLTTDKTSSDLNVISGKGEIKLPHHANDCVQNKDSPINSENPENKNNVSLASAVKAEHANVILVSPSSSVGENTNSASSTSMACDPQPHGDLDSHSSTSDITSSVPKSFMRSRDASLKSPTMECGSKRSFGSAIMEEETVSFQKRPCLTRENVMAVNEDSNISIYSEPDLQTATASQTERPTSVMSSAVSSSGSSDDILILLSSDDEVDVGDDNFMHRENADKAIENDHGNMYSKGAQNSLMDCYHQLMKERIKRGHRQLDPKQFRLIHRSHLERERRTRLKVLFDELQNCVHVERGHTEDLFMSRGKVLDEARDLIIDMKSNMERSDKAVKLQEKQNKILKAKLDAIKEDLLKKNMSSEAIDKVLREAIKQPVIHHNSSERQCALKRTGLSDCQLLHIEPESTADAEENQDLVNLVSPSTEEEKDSDRQNPGSPVYEDISDPEEPTAPCYEDITDVEETAETKYEDISDPENV